VREAAAFPRLETISRTGTALTVPGVASDYGVSVGWHVIAPGGDQIVFRRLAGAQPGIRDFRSDREKGKEPGAEEAWVEHAGLSTFDALAPTIAVVVRFPVWVAELKIPSGRRCSIAKTGPPRHYTIWGEPRVLLGSVVRVYRQGEASGSLEAVS
jgi:hypothetical protein